MPRPPAIPELGTRRMRARLLSAKLWKCRPVSAAVGVACLWVCLITAINLFSLGGSTRWSLKYETYRPRGRPFVPDTLDLSSGYRYLYHSRQSAGQNHREHIQASMDLSLDGSMKNGVISGRRMQEIKAAEMERLETMPRVYGGDSGNILISAERDRIDRKAINAMEIKPDVQTTKENPKDLLPNWTPEPVTGPSSSSLSNVTVPERSRSPETSKRDWVISSRAKSPLSVPDSRDRKTRSGSAVEGEPSDQGDSFKGTADDIQMRNMATELDSIEIRGLDEGGRSTSNHLPGSIGATHNRQNNFYDPASKNPREIRIDARLNGSMMYTAREIEVSTYRNSSRTHGSYSPSPRAITDSVRNTQRLKGTLRKSNREIPVAMQMKVPNRNDDFSQPLLHHDDHVTETDASPKSKSKQSFSFAKFPTGNNYNLTNDGPTSGYTPSQNDDHSNLSVKVNPLSVANDDSVSRQIRLSTYWQSGDQQPSSREHSIAQGSRTITYSLVNLSLAQSRSSSATTEAERASELRHESPAYDGFELYSYNVTASNMISLDRSVPDTRPDSCSDITDIKDLPTASIIICFHNEALSVLLRTVHSILNRSPAELLDQIILVDDNSTLEDLKTGLTDELRGFSEKIVLVRTSRREGLVRARLLGSELATSEVIVFLDAHCECNDHWLEPLLSSLKHHPNKVVSPYIDTIKAESFQYKRSPAHLKGGFNWRLEFGWRAASSGNRLAQEQEPIKTPAISGGLFAIRRSYFQFIGGYDPELEIWGGENFELSFKTWMCGGTLEILPCSRVGHVFRTSLPYSFHQDREHVVLRNLGRVASVWMDDFAQVFYAAVGMPDDLDLGNLTQRQQLRKSLKCHSFDWYLSNVFPQLELISENTKYYGMVRNKGSLMCLDVMNSANEFFLGLSPCHGGRNQTFRLTADNNLFQDEACIMPGVNKQLFLSVCKQNHSWIYKNEYLKLDQIDLCLTSVDNELVQLLPCDYSQKAKAYTSKFKQENVNNRIDYIDKFTLTNSFQQWTFDYTFNWKRRRRRN